MNHEYTTQIERINLRLIDYERTGNIKTLEEAYRLLTEVRSLVGNQLKEIKNKCG